MEIKRVLRFGRNYYEMTAQGTDLGECVAQLGKLSFDDVNQCRCGSDDLTLRHRKTHSGFQYTFIKCGECGAERNFGQRKDDPQVYYLKPEWKDAPHADVMG